LIHITRTFDLSYFNGGIVAKVREEEYENSQNVLTKIYQIINMQVLGLASTVDFFNLHPSIVKPKEKPLIIIVGGLI
jgi:hypothetical protein